MSDLRNRYEERERERQRRAQQGRAPMVAMPEAEQPVVFRDYSKQNAADAAITRPSYGSDPRSRLGQPRPTAPDPNLVTITLSPADIRFQREAEAHMRQSMQAAANRIAAENAQRERQRIAAAAEQERLRVAGETWEIENAQRKIQNIIGSLTVADAATVSTIVRQKFPSSIGDPAAWALALSEFRDIARVRQVWDRTPLDVIEDHNDGQLAARFDTSVEVVQRLRAEEL